MLGKEGALWGGAGGKSACLCSPKAGPQSLPASSDLFWGFASPVRSPLRALSFLWFCWARFGSFPVPPKSNHDKVGLFKSIFTWKLNFK